MKYCYECGEKLHMKELEHEGMVPFCEACRAYRFPIFSTAISMVTLNPKRDKILMIQQYGKPNNILVAGYVNKEECAEDAMIREMQEEIGRKVLEYRFLRSEYFPKTNTLIFNFAVVIDSECLENVSTWEVDRAAWFTFDEAKASVKPEEVTAILKSVEAAYRPMQVGIDETMTRDGVILAKEVRVRYGLLQLLWDLGLLEDYSTAFVAYYRNY